MAKITEWADEEKQEQNWKITISNRELAEALTTLTSHERERYEMLSRHKDLSSQILAFALLAKSIERNQDRQATETSFTSYIQP